MKSATTIESLTYFLLGIFSFSISVDGFSFMEPKQLYASSKTQAKDIPAGLFYCPSSSSSDFTVTVTIIYLQLYNIYYITVYYLYYYYILYINGYELRLPTAAKAAACHLFHLSLPQRCFFFHPFSFFLFYVAFLIHVLAF